MLLPAWRSNAIALLFRPMARASLPVVMLLPVAVISPLRRHIVGTV